MMALSIRNARVVTRENVILGGLTVEEGKIVSLEGEAGSGSLDFEGDYLIPGLIELHTDNLERHFSPRPGVKWPAAPALIAHDSQIAASGITTVFDALRIGTLAGDRDYAEHVAVLADAVHLAQKAGHLRAEHFLHLRCEVSCESVVEDLQPFLADPLLRLVSIMDHTPGQRQFVRLDKYREYFQGKYQMSDTEIDSFVEKQRRAHETYANDNRKRIVKLCRAREVPLASHDDATEAHVQEAKNDGMVVAEFPTSIEAAAQSQAEGLSVLMGAPNVVRGGSHSGNVSARDLAEQGLLDLLSSDYVPCSLLHAAFLLPDVISAMDLPQAIATVTATPAETTGLQDRGEIAGGKRADFVRVRYDGHHPVVLALWRGGRRIL